MKPLAQNSMISNRYLIIQMIGKGGMGEVYLAVDQRLGSAVALKRTMFKENPELGIAFEREAKILGRLRHPVLPKVIDHFSEGNDQFLIMENISGEDLGKRLEAAGKPFPLSWVMFWSDQLLDALAYLHSHEPPIIHRDIKPENLKLTDDNHIVLLDFGLSKDFDSRSESASLGTGSVVGYSPYFASMEQVRGTGTDARSDLYSFSATMYQLLTNTIPPDALTRADAMLGGQTDPIVPISDINPEVSKGISDVILKGMAVRQDARYGTATEMQKDLRRAFNQGTEASASAQPPSEAQTQMMAIPDAIANATERIATPTSPETESSGQATLVIDNASTDAAIRQADIKTQIIRQDEGEIEQETADIAQDTTIRDEEPPPAVEVAAAAAAPSSPQVAQTRVSTPMPVAAPPPKKKSKAGLVIGGLFGLLILGGLAASGGWYAYKNYYLPSRVQASPTPTAEPPVTPSPEPNPTVMVQTSPSPDANSNTDVADANTSTPHNRGSVPNPPSTRPTPGTTVSQNPPKTPAVKPTPKPKGGDRTVILQ